MHDELVAVQIISLRQNNIWPCGYIFTVFSYVLSPGYSWSYFYANIILSKQITGSVGIYTYYINKHNSSTIIKKKTS